MQIRFPFASRIIAFLCLATYAVAQSVSPVRPQARLLRIIDESDTVTLAGNVHPLVALASGAISTPLDQTTPMQHMILHLKSDPSQESALAQLIAQQNDPKSPLFHHYLSPKDFGSQFGIATADVAKVVAWLESRGFTIDRVPASNRAIVFSGTAGQVTSAFGTEIRSYRIAGEKHIANAGNPKIPAALANVVGGIVQLHDFQAKHSTTTLTPLPAAKFANPEYNTAAGHYLAPADFAAIYDVNPLYSAGITGAGQSIAVVSRSNIALSDIRIFRTTFGLPDNDPQIVIVDVDPGYRYDGNSTEATLDTEWAGAIAPQAAIKLVAGRCTNTSDGVTEAELYAVNNNVSPIISVSYGLCEAAMGTSELAFYNALWQQAAAQGQSVIVSSGDSGAAGCNSESDSSASVAGVNGLCSSPYSTCVGGTEFVEGNNPGQYWLPGNNAAAGSAIGYIPETVWNESGSNSGSGLIAGGGGASSYFAKPSWQTGVGVPADGKRDVPDLSLSAAQHDGYAIYQAWAGGLFSVGGTSLSTPSFAGLMALVNQKAGSSQGSANPTLYALAARQAAGGAGVFHDITSGNNSVPGVTGFYAAQGYDLSSGLGSVDADVLVNHWSDAAPGLSLVSSNGTLSVNSGQTVHTTITSNAGGALNSAVALTVTGLPAGVTAAFSPSTIAAPGSGSATLSIATTLSAKSGSYTLNVTGTAGGQTAILTLPLVVGSPSFVLSANKTNLILNLPGSAAATLTSAAQSGFSSPLSLTVSGAPTGVTVTLSPKTIAAPGSGSAVLNIAANTSTTPGTYPLTITAQGGGQTQKLIVYLVIPTFTVTAPAGFYKGAAGGSVTIPVTITPDSGFGSSITLLQRANYLPSGVTSSFSPATVSGSSPSTSTVTMNLAKTLPNGAYPFFIDGKGGSITQGVYEWLLVGIEGSCSIAVYNAAYNSNILSVTAGQSVTGQAVCLWPQGSFSGPLTVSFSGVPTGMTVQTAAPLMGDGKAVALQVSVPQTMAAGTYSMSISVASGGFTATSPFSVTVTANSFVLTTTQSALKLGQGSAASFSVASAHKGVFNSPVTLALSGLPIGIAASLAKSAFIAPGDGSTTATISATANAAPGTYTATLTATGGGLTQTVPIALSVVTPTCTLGASVKSMSLSAGQSATAQLSCTSVLGAFGAPLSLAVSGAPAGVTTSTSSRTLAAGATTTMLISSPLSTPPSSFTLSVSAVSGSFSQTISIPVTLAASNFTVSAAQSALSLNAGTTAPVTVAAVHHGMFSSPVYFSWSGLPTGVSVSLTKPALPAPGDGATTTTFIAAASTTPGTYTATLTAIGGTLTQTVPVALTIRPAPSCSLTVNYPASPMVITAGQSSTIPVTCSGVQGSFNAPLSVSLTGSLSGVTAKLSAPTIAAGGSLTVQLTTLQSVSTSTLSLSLTASGSGFTKTVPISATVNASSFTVTAAQAAMTIKQASSGQVSLATAHIGVFNSPVSFSWSGLPAGVAASLSQAATPAPGDGTATTTFSVASSAKLGKYTATLIATGGGQTKTFPVAMTIAAK